MPLPLLSAEPCQATLGSSDPATLDKLDAVASVLQARLDPVLVVVHLVLYKRRYGVLEGSPTMSGHVGQGAGRFTGLPCIRT